MCAFFSLLKLALFRRGRRALVAPRVDVPISLRIEVPQGPILTNGHADETLQCLIQLTGRIKIKDSLTRGTSLNLDCVLVMYSPKPFQKVTPQKQKHSTQLRLPSHPRHTSLHPFRPHQGR